MKGKHNLWITAAAILAVFLPACKGSSDIREMEFVDSILWTKAYDIKVEGDRGYCAFMNGLMILDLSPRRPTQVSRLYLGGGNGIDIDGSLACVAAGIKGLCVVDVSDESTPVLSGSLITPGEARDVAVSGGFAFVADGAAGLQVVDLKRTDRPRIIAGLDTPGEAEDVVLSGSRAYIADGEGGVHIVDVTDPSAPGLIGSFDTPDTAERVAVSGDYLYVADGSSGLQVLDITRPETPEQAASYTTAGYAHSVKVLGNYAYVGNLYDGGFEIVDITDPSTPARAGWTKYTMYNEAWELAVEGDTAFVVDYFAGVYRISVEDKTRPRSRGYYYTPGSIIAAEALGERICALGDLSGFRVLDGTVPGALKETGSNSPFRGVHGMAAAGRHGYSTDRWGL